MPRNKAEYAGLVTCLTAERAREPHVVLRMKLTGSAMVYSTIRHMLVAQNIDLVRQDNAVKSSTE